MVIFVLQWTQSTQDQDHRGTVDRILIIHVHIKWTECISENK